MSDAEMIKRAFFDFRKTADAPKLAQGMEVFRPSGQQLPCVALVPHIPDELVFLRVEYGKERERKLDDAERGARCPPLAATVRIMVWRSSVARICLSARDRSATMEGCVMRARRGGRVLSVSFMKSAFLWSGQVAGLGRGAPALWYAELPV